MQPTRTGVEKGLGYSVERMALPLRFGIGYDFRNPAGSVLSTPELYGEVLDQIELAEEWGFDVVWFSEHHFVEDGYLPSWTPVAGAVLGRTRRMRVATDIALLPFYHPVRLAEDVAVLDNLSNGRVELGVGMGYAPHEFKGFGIPVGRRVSLTEEGIEILRLAWSGRPFTYHGKRWAFEDLLVTPTPVQAGGPPLWMAAMTAAGADRAARFGANFLPQGNRAGTLDRWRAAVRAGGADPDERRVGIIRSVLVTDDKDRDWPQVRQAERYRMEAYARFFAEAEASFGLGGAGAISQAWIVGGPDQVYDELASFIATHRFTDVCTWGCPPGLAPSQMARYLERFATEVIPRLRAEFG